MRVLIAEDLALLRDGLAVMAEGRSNAAIAARLFITEKAVSKHIHSIFPKLTLPPSDDDHRRVLTVLTYLNGANGANSANSTAG